MGMSTAVKVSPAEYLELERKAKFKSEYVDGTIVPMPGASRIHNLIGSHVNRLIGNQLVGRPCEVYINDMKVWAPKSYSYPDVTVVCGEPLFGDIQTDILLNPIVIIEILSPSTEVYDRGNKFASYRQLENLQEYVLVSQKMPYIEVFKRQTNGWHFSEVAGLENSLILESIECTLKLSEIYDKVDFSQAEQG
jgi:Uma2 family endonuclease